MTFDFPRAGSHYCHSKTFLPGAVLQGIINFKLSIISGALHEVTICFYSRSDSSFSKNAVRDFSNNRVGDKQLRLLLLLSLLYYIRKSMKYLKHTLTSSLYCPILIDVTFQSVNAKRNTIYLSRLN